MVEMGKIEKVSPVGSLVGVAPVHSVYLFDLFFVVLNEWFHDPVAKDQF